MTVWTVRAGSLLVETALVQAARVLPDTIVTLSVPVAQGFLPRFTSVLSSVMTLAILVLTVALVPAAWNFRKSYKKINHLVDKVYADVTPIVRHAHAIADNVDYLTATMRSDVQRVHRTVTLANDRLLAALDAAERRVRDLEAFLDVAQREAEGVFVSAAATARGVRYGTATLREELEQEREDGLAAAPLGRRRVMDHEEDSGDDEFDTTDDGGGDDSPRGPRIRPRRDAEDDLA